jgi:hypothetical protein
MAGLRGGSVKATQERLLAATTLAGSEAGDAGNG